MIINLLSLGARLARDGVVASAFDGRVAKVIGVDLQRLRQCELLDKIRSSFGILGFQEPEEARKRAKNHGPVPSERMLQIPTSTSSAFGWAANTT